MKVAMLAVLCVMPFGMTTGRLGNNTDKPFTEMPSKPRSTEVSKPPATADIFLATTTPPTTNPTCKADGEYCNSGASNYDPTCCSGVCKKWFSGFKTCSGVAGL